MNHMTDENLEKFIKKIKESNNSSNKLFNYKKATARLDELKNEYNNLCLAIKSDKKTIVKKHSNKENKKLNTEKIIKELNEINSQMDDERSNLASMIDNYIRYKLLLDDLEIESENIKNEIFKVEQNKSKIIIHKLDLDEML